MLIRSLITIKIRGCSKSLFEELIFQIKLRQVLIMSIIILINPTERHDASKKNNTNQRLHEKEHHAH